MFDNVEHEWLMKFFGHRIGDKRVLRYVKGFLKAGVFELGEIAATEQGPPARGSNIAVAGRHLPALQP